MRGLRDRALNSNLSRLYHFDLMRCALPLLVRIRLGGPAIQGRLGTTDNAAGHTCCRDTF